MDAVRCFEGKRQNDWDVYIPQLAGAIRATVNRSTGQTPNFMMFGREINIPADLMFASVMTEESMLVNEYIQKLVVSLSSDSFTILGLWVLGLAVSNINESQLQTYESKTLFLMTSLQYYCIPGLAEIKTYAQKMQDAQLTKSLIKGKSPNCSEKTQGDPKTHEKEL